MKKRILALALCALLALAALPASAAAQNEVMGLIVNDVDVSTAADPADLLGDGTVRFDMAAGVLTLTNASLTAGVSDPAQDWAEHPAILFGGKLTIHLRGNNTIDTGNCSVMGQALRNSAICGDALIVTADPGATLEVKGMVAVKSYDQSGGAVHIEMENYHSQIMKWAMYVQGGPLTVTGGSLTAASTGGKRGGAIGIEESTTVNIIDGAVLAEGDWGFDSAVAALSFSGGLMPTSKNYVKIEAPESASPKNIAYESGQMVELDGNTKVRLPAYALKDENGNPTNYVRLRDLAALLDTGAAEFDVLWSAETGISIAPHTPYDHPNGSEGNVPFSGDRPYTDYGQPTSVGGKLTELKAFQIIDDAGGAHTYYQLRDLGRALDFNVGWSADRGIFIESNKPYTDAD